MNIGKAIKQVRKACVPSISQGILAKKLELTSTSIANLEQDKVFPRKLLLNKLANNLGVSVDYILLCSLEDSSVMEEDKKAFSVTILKLKSMMNKIKNEL